MKFEIESLRPHMLKLRPEILVKDGKKQFAVLPYEEFLAAQERLADAEDLIELRTAKRKAGKKPSIPLSEVKRQLGLRGLDSKAEARKAVIPL